MSYISSQKYTLYYGKKGKVRKFYRKVVRIITCGIQFLMDTRGRLTKRIEREINKINQLPRYIPSETGLLGKRIKFLDKSVVANYQEIFGKEIYKFDTSNPAPLIIDCGANIGVSVIWFKQHYPGATIIAFEADPNIFRVLDENIRGYGFRNVILIPKAIWSTETTLPFYLEGGNSSRIATDVDTNNIIEIQAVSLRPYLNQTVDFLKIDIEGVEFDVLESCKDLLGNVQNIFIEYHSFLTKPQKLGDLLLILSNAGFRYYIQQTGVVSPYPFCQIDDLIGIDLQLNIFAYRA